MYIFDQKYAYFLCKVYLPSAKGSLMKKSFRTFAPVMRHTFLTCIMLLALMSGCIDNSNKFTVKGRITGAEDSTLVLEHLEPGGYIATVEETKLGKDGAFELHGDRPGNPEFYRLRIGDRFINLSIDSTETIEVEAKLESMADDYTVKGSGSCDTIRILSQKLAQLSQKSHAIAEDRSLTLRERDDSILAEIERYKKDIKLNFIQNHYHLAGSYFALFQTLRGEQLFDVENDPSDVAWVSAIANAWKERWPDSERAKALEQTALKGHRNTRRGVMEIDMESEKVSETGIIDMGFPDINGHEQRISSLKGKVVILDFTAYGIKGSAERNLELRTLYNKYHDRGLEIYQVAIDTDEHFWQTMCRQLPWVCVWNPGGQYNDIMTIYNVQQVPTWFLVDRDNNLVGRQGMVGNIEDELLKLL